MKNGKITIFLRMLKPILKFVRICFVIF